jgi:predicted DNA-binding protein
LINDSTRGVFYSINLLRRLQFILTNGNFDYIPRFDKEIKDLQILVSRLETEVKRRLQDLKEDESRSKANVIKKAAMRGTLEKLLKTMDEYYNSLIRLRSRFYAKEICQRMLNLIERGTKSDDGKINFTGLISDINKLTGNLGVLKDIFKKKYNYFIQKQENSFNLFVYEPDDIKNEYYTRYIGSGQNAHDKIKELSFKLLKELGASDVTDIVNILKDSDAKAVEENMLKFAKLHFEKIKDDYNITDILFEKDIIRSESKIRGMLAQAYPWLRILEIPGRFKLDDSAKKFYVGVKTNTSSFRKLQTLIHSIIGTSVEFKDSADNSSITFYSEWAGFPLFYSYTIADEMKPYYKQLSKNHNIDLHIDKNYYFFKDIIPLTAEERTRLDESYRAYLMGLIFDVFNIITEYDEETGTEKAIYKYTMQEGITVKRTEQLGIESRLINRLFEEQGREALRYNILKDVEAVQNEMLRNNCLAEMLVIYEYYYENIYKLDETEISGEAKRKVETYQYSIVRNLAKEIERKIKDNERSEFIKKVKTLKENMDSFTKLCGDGEKRVLRLDKILNRSKIKLPEETAGTQTVKENGGITKGKLKELKEALDEGLISEEEYNKAKKNFLKFN